MAYLLDLTYRCEKCGRPAKYEVMNTVNAGCGRFCREHAEEKLRELQVRETIRADLRRDRISEGKP